jgi:hypothetical protein
LPDASNDIRKIRNTSLPSIALELTARLELRCSTAEAPAFARLPPICSTRQWLTERTLCRSANAFLLCMGLFFTFLQEG